MPSSAFPPSHTGLLFTRCLQLRIIVTINVESRGWNRREGFLLCLWLPPLLPTFPPLLFGCVPRSVYVTHLSLGGMRAMATGVVQLLPDAEC